MVPVTFCGHYLSSLVRDVHLFKFFTKTQVLRAFVSFVLVFLVAFCNQTLSVFNISFRIVGIFFVVTLIVVRTFNMPKSGHNIFDEPEEKPSLSCGAHIICYELAARAE